MPDNATQVVPDAIYFDANALIGAPCDLATQPIAEALGLANTLEAQLLVPELAAEEVIARRCEEAIKTAGRIKSDASRLGTLLGRDPLTLERIKEADIRNLVRQSHSSVLAQAGFQIIPTPEIAVRDFTQLFLDKHPPFNDGDKGFKDAVIVETVFHHSCTDNKHGHIVVVSSDKALGHSAIAARFSRAGTTMTIVEGAPADLFANLVDVLKNALTEANNAEWMRLHNLATAFAKQHEQQILEFVHANARIGLSDLYGYGFRSYGRRRDATDEQLKDARIVSVDSVRPLEVVSAYASDSAFDRMPGRVSFLITVAIEVDLTIAKRPWYGLFNEPRVSLENANTLPQTSLLWNQPEVQEHITVKRELTVTGSVAAERAGSGSYDDLRLERV